MTDDNLRYHRRTYEEERAYRARQQASRSSMRQYDDAPASNGRTRVSSTLRDYERPLTHAPASSSSRSSAGRSSNGRSSYADRDAYSDRGSYAERDAYGEYDDYDDYAADSRRSYAERDDYSYDAHRTYSERDGYSADARRAYADRNDYAAGDAPYAPVSRSASGRPSANRAAAQRSSSQRPSANRPSSRSAEPERSRYSRSSYGSRASAREAYGRDSYGSGRSTRSGRSGNSGRSPRSNDRSAASAQGAAAILKTLSIKKIIIIVALLAFIALGVKLCTMITPITVTVNGTEMSLRGAKTVQTAADECGLPLNPGDLISLKGTVLKKKEGEKYSAYVNGEKVTDYNMPLKNGDSIVLKDGEDIVEEYDAVQQAIPHGASMLGVGAVHVYTSAGADGILETRTGKLSGETVEKTVKEPEDLVMQRYNVNPPASEKVIALTFDDGPHQQYTKEILDILDEYNIKATFFIIGYNVEKDNNDELLRRAYKAGHQLCSHTYDHAEPSGGLNITTMDPAGQIDEIQHGRQVISDAIGVEASRVVRLPGGYLDDPTMVNIQPYIDAEIGWNVDTKDWSYPGVDSIVSAILCAESGDIVLCHDGGGDREDTVAALRIALPQLIAQGYRFITIDEMMTYPAYQSE